MRKVCLVNNFNYGMYLPACLTSIENQSLPFDAVIIVDDGSTDNSQDIISSYCDRLASWESIFKSNGGQLSCFHAALPWVKDDDLVTLLDSDDLYPADYLERLVEKTNSLKADFYFCEIIKFETASEARASSAVDSGGVDFLIESSSSLMRQLRCWIGSPTSAIALKGYLYKELLPYPYERDWITRADDVIVFGSSILNARKAYLGTLGIAYRVHGANHFFGKKFDEYYKLRRKHNIEKLFGWFCEKQHIKVEADKHCTEQEFSLIPKELRKRFSLPSSIIGKEKKRRWWRRASRRFR